MQVPSPRKIRASAQQKVIPTGKHVATVRTPRLKKSKASNEMVVVNIAIANIEVLDFLTLNVKENGELGYGWTKLLALYNIVKGEDWIDGAQLTEIVAELESAGPIKCVVKISHEFRVETSNGWTTVNKAKYLESDGQKAIHPKVVFYYPQTEKVDHEYVEPPDMYPEQPDDDSFDFD